MQINTTPGAIVHLTCGDYDILARKVEAGDDVECPEGHGQVQVADFVPVGLNPVVTF